MGTTAPRTVIPHSSFDSVVLAAVVSECQDLVGARLQQVLPSGLNGLALALRTGGRTHRLLLSTHPRFGRVHLVEALEPAAPVPFAQLVRGRLEGARLTAVATVEFERIFTCTFETLEGPYDLIAEIMGRHSNLILCAGGVIVGALKQIGPDRSRVREVLPHRPYTPPPQMRPTPVTVAAVELAERGDRPAWRAVFEAVSGIGPALAWEACVRAGAAPDGPLDEDAAVKVASSLHAIGSAVAAARFDPVLYRGPDGAPAAYAPFPMVSLEHLQPERSSMSAAVEAVAQSAVGRARFEETRQGLAATVRQALDRLHRTLAAVAEDAQEAEGADRLREQGELILAYLSQIAPRAAVLEVPGFDGRPVSIPLDPTRSGVENAQACFKRYAKAAAARRRLPERQAALETDRAFLEESATTIAQAEDADDLWEVEQDLISSGVRKRARPAGRPRAVASGRSFDLPGGLRVQVGRSARENDHLTFEVAGPDDLWLHARGMPGAHVILTGARGQPGEESVLAAARIAAYYSDGRSATRVPVDVTKRRFVRRIRGGRPGQVHYSGERTLAVAPGLPPRPSTH
ncbi:MAG: NFACT family protein [bacterium]|nr:NFACT family protein [bacterium]